MLQFSTLLFDLDDTLIDSSKIYKESLAAIGVDIEGSDYLNARAQTKRRLPSGHVSARNRLLYLKELLMQKGQFSPSSALDLMYKYEAEIEQRSIQRWTNCKYGSILEQLSQTYKMAILTNENLRTQLIKLRAIDPNGNLFKRVFTSEEYGFEKPDPKLFEQALIQLEVEPSKCIMIGNQIQTDLFPAASLGIYSILTQEFNSPEEKLYSFRCHTIRKLSQLPLLLNTINTQSKRLTVKEPPTKVLAELSQKIGSRIPAWSQGTGGNVSVKDGETMWIKSSGTRLNKVTSQLGQTELNLYKLRRMLRQIQEAKNLSINTEIAYSKSISEAVVSSLTGNSRPSMEAGFHAALPHKYVAHFHSLAAIVMGHFQDEFLNNFHIEGNANLTFIPAIQPGWELYEAISAYIVKNTSDFAQANGLRSQIFILKNHGIILGFNDLGYLNQWEETERAFCRRFGLNQIHRTMEPHFELKTKELERLATPFKIYFPDAAVFKDRIYSLLQSEDPNSFRLKALQPQSACDAIELWAASQILFQDCPDLPEFPTELSSKIASLPTEIFRRQIYDQT